jgi:hypothetical protein
MKKMTILSIAAGMTFLFFTFAFPQTYVFSKPNVPVNDDSLGRHEHYPVSPGFHGLATSGDTLYATWHDNRDGNFKIYFSKSTDGGATWGRNVIVNDTTTATHYEPAIAVDAQGYIYIAWYDDRRQQPGKIYLAKSTNGGLTFGQNINVNPTTTGWGPSVVTWGLNKVAVAWYASVGPQIGGVCATSTDGGMTFGPTIRMCDSLPGETKGPSIGFDDQGRVCAVWESFINSRYHILYYTRATDPSDSIFLPQIPIADTGAWFPSQGGPSLVTGSGGKVYVVWMDGRNVSTRGFEVYFAKSTNYGATFGPNILVDDYTEWSTKRWPSIAIDDSSGVYTTWDDSRNGNSAIYFAKSTDDGASFGPNVIVDDSAANDTAPRYYANVAVNRQTGEAFVIWADERNEPAPRTALDVYSAWGIPTSGVESGGRLFGGSRQLLKVGQNRANPFTNSTSISYEISENSLVSFVILDVSGQVVKNLLKSEEVKPGKHVILWDGSTEGGGKAKSGVYFYQLVAYGSKSGKTVSAARKMTLLK